MPTISSEEGNKDASEMVNSGGGSPVIKHKAKRRRVILDSDESDSDKTESEANVHNVNCTDRTLNGIADNTCEGNSLSQSSANTGSPHLKETELNVATASSSNQRVEFRNTTRDERLSSSTTRVAMSESPVTASCDTDQLKTPPKRSTGK